MAAKAGKGHAQPVQWGRRPLCRLPGPRPRLGKSQREPRPYLQKSCSELSPRRAMTQTPACHKGDRHPQVLVPRLTVPGYAGAVPRLCGLTRTPHSRQ